MDKKNCIEIFNAMIRGTPISFKEKLIPLISEYLTEIKCENFEKLINLITQNPQIIQNMMPEIVRYFCKKYNILSLTTDQKGLQKTILYYG